MANKFKFSDEIIGRFINIVQEAMISGTDVLDLFREMHVRPSDGDPNELVLTEEYTKKVDDWHKQIEQDLVIRRNAYEAAHGAPAVFLTGTGDGSTVGGVAKVDGTKKVN